MAYTNFIPELWAEKIQRENEKMLVLAKLCNRQWEGELKKKGDTVHILGIGAPTIGIMTAQPSRRRKRWRIPPFRW